MGIINARATCNIPPLTPMRLTLFSELQKPNVRTLGLINWPSLPFHMDFRPYGPAPVRPKRKKYTPVDPQFTDEQIVEFDRQNWENYIYYFRTELKKMKKGELAHELFSPRDCQLLRRRGVFIRRNNPKNTGRFILSPKALETLKAQR